MENLKKSGYDIPWDVHSLIIGKRPSHLKNMIKKHVLENKVTCVVLCDFITDLSDFEDTKGIWEEVQEAIDLVEEETGKRLPLSIVYTTEGDLKGTHPDFAEAALRITRNEIERSGIPKTQKWGSSWENMVTPQEMAKKMSLVLTRKESVKISGEFMIKHFPV